MRMLVIVILLLGAAVAGLWYSTFRPQPLPVEGRVSFTPPPADPPRAMRLSVLHTGRMDALAAMAYRGGALSELRTFGMDAVLIEHPAGDLLIDTGFGRDVEAHFRTTPALMQLTSSFTKETPVVDQLRAAGRDPDALAGVILTHAHWDHVSGLADFGDVPVWITAEEMAYIESDDAGALLARQLSPETNWRVYDFPDGPFLGFPASWDVHGDASVVVVPAG
ncbi:MAG: MBL fold metallo-hydrolase, partial [Algiphilus sp.]